MFLGLDLGTTNVKALVTSDSGAPLGEGSSPVRLFHVADGGVEQDIEEIWSATIAAIRLAISETKAPEIRAIGVSSQGGALQLLNIVGADINRRTSSPKEGSAPTAVSPNQPQPVGRVISWLDQRGRASDAKLTNELGQEWFAERLGHRGAGVAVGQLMRLGSQHHIGFVGDTIVGRLCGRGAQDGTSAALALLYNPILREYDPELLLKLGIQKSQLPDLMSPRVAAGKLLPSVARATGLPKGIPVSAAIHDQYAAALGIGAVRPGTTMVGAGTAWVLLAVSDRPMVPVVENAFVCHHVAEGSIPGATASLPASSQSHQLAGGVTELPKELYGQIVSLVNGGSSLTWALELMGLERLGHAELERLLASAPAGCDGVSFWPFMARAGGAGVAPTTKGRLSGLQLAHKPAHVARAIVEGLAFELKRHLLFLERGSVPVERLVMGGGTAASQVTTQIIADVSGLPVACFGAGAGSALGAAVLARGLVDARPSLTELSEEMVPASRVVEVSADAGFYAQRFEDYVTELK